MRLLLWLPFLLWGQAPYSIVLVHIGQTMPSYVEIALSQARSFNEEAPIILLASEKALDFFCPRANITLVSLESLPLTPEHELFKEIAKVNNNYMRYTSERFLYLYDYMAVSGAENVFHIENDVLLYANLQEMLPVFQKYYPGIGVTFESSSKGIPGFVYIANKKAMQKLAHYFAIKASRAVWDMKILALFWEEHKEDIACLPMIMERYLLEHTPPSFENRLFKNKRLHCNHIAEFNSIFDGAAIGVFFDGLDPIRGNYPPGYIMKALFNPSEIAYKWEVDALGRRVPYAIYKGEIYRINNLHIASKRLERFTSL